MNFFLFTTSENWIHQYDIEIIISQSFEEKFCVETIKRPKCEFDGNVDIQKYSTSNTFDA